MGPGGKWVGNGILPTISLKLKFKTVFKLTTIIIKIFRINFKQKLTNFRVGNRWERVSNGWEMVFGPQLA